MNGVSGSMAKAAFLITPDSRIEQFVNDIAVNIVL